VSQDSRSSAASSGRSLHAAGPRPGLEYLREIILKGADPAERLEAFAGLDPAIVAAIGADVLPPLAICVWGDQQ
jgi:hypothetical protein